MSECKVKKYRKKPVVIEAVQFKGDVHNPELLALIQKASNPKPIVTVLSNHILINTFHEDYRKDTGQWIDEYKEKLTTLLASRPCVDIQAIADELIDENVSLNLMPDDEQAEFRASVNESFQRHCHIKQIPVELASLCVDVDGAVEAVKEFAIELTKEIVWDKFKIVNMETAEESYEHHRELSSEFERLKAYIHRFLNAITNRFQPCNKCEESK